MISDEEAQHLEQVAVDLRETIKGLREDMARADAIRVELNQLTRSGRLTRMIVISVSVIVFIVMVIGATQIYSLKRLDDVVTIQHDSALCPLYQIFINADTPAARDAAIKRGDDMSQRDRAFTTIRQSYNALNCQAK